MNDLYVGENNHYECSVVRTIIMIRLTIFLEPTYLHVLENTQQRKVTQMCGWIDNPAILHA